MASLYRKVQKSHLVTKMEQLQSERHHQHSYEACILISFPISGYSEHVDNIAGQQYQDLKMAPPATQQNRFPSFKATQMTCMYPMCFSTFL